jgi:hypothetical protein
MIARARWAGRAARVAGLARVAAALAAASCAACSRSSGGATEVQEAPASPQAKAVPAQLAAVPQLSPSGALPLSLDAGPPPVPLRGDIAAAGDVVGTKEVVGYSLQAVFRPAELLPPPRGAEVSQAGLEAARRKTEPRMTIDLSATRARIVLGAGFVLPAGSELRARVDRYGFFLVADGGASYRTAAPGSLRALLGERRLDVAPLSPADVASRGDGPRILGYRTRRVELVTRAANATIEIAHVTDSGDGGSLLCRALLDLVNAPPSTPLCGWEEVPLHADLRWTKRGALAFEVTSIARHTDLSPLLLAAPPPTSVFLPTPPPPSPGEPLLGQNDLAAFRVLPVDVPDAGIDPALGLVLVNSTDELRLAWLDGVPVAWVGPGARVAVPGLVRGRYTLQWRTFLGDVLEPAESVTVPGQSRVGLEDGGL